MPLSSFEKTNLKSNQIRTFLLLILGLFCVYLCGCGMFVLIRSIGEYNPAIWNAIVTFLNGMSIEFALDQAGPLFKSSIIFLVISIIFGTAFLLLRWQILRAGLLATALLSLAHLSCAVLLLVIESRLAHALILGLLAILFLVIFIVYSNISIYLKDRTYPDVVLESLVALYFLIFIGRMLIMALIVGPS